ncbi:PrgI family protein [Rossellomorea aquimaris]|nr:PrgI family protein [Rossellomorea aquimaris]
MNNEIVLPIDLTQEDKEVLAIFSMRQFLLCFPAVVGGLAFLIWGKLPFLSGAFESILRIVLIVTIIGIAGALAFIKLEKYEQYLSQYILTMLRFRRSQKTYTS